MLHFNPPPGSPRRRPIDRSAPAPQPAPPARSRRARKQALEQRRDSQRPKPRSAAADRPPRPAEPEPPARNPLAAPANEQHRRSAKPSPSKPTLKSVAPAASLRPQWLRGRLGQPSLGGRSGERNAPPAGRSAMGVGPGPLPVGKMPVGKMPVGRGPVSKMPMGKPAPGQPAEAESKADRLRRGRGGGSGPRRGQRPASPLVKVVRMLILGIGVWAIAGTTISIWNPQLRHPDTASQSVSAVAVASSTDSSIAQGNGREITTLAAQITPLTRGLTDLTPGLFLVDLDSGDYFSLNGTTSFASASMIKLPVLIALMQDVDAGRIRLDDTLILQQKDIGDGSGDMQFATVGTNYSVLEVATVMMTHSDNTATNLIIRRLGGMEVLNQRFREWGLDQTTLRNLLPDLEGTNTTTPKELATLIGRISEGDLLSNKSRDRALDIMQHVLTDSLLPTSIEPGATIAHKTGDIGSLVGDVGVIDTANGKRYAIAVMVKRPHNDERAQELIRQMAKVVYEQFDPPRTTPPDATSPDATSPDATSPDATSPDAVPSAAPESAESPAVEPPILESPDPAAPSPEPPGTASPTTP